jgi:phosphatidylglycerophosphate synthase
VQKGSLDLPAIVHAPLERFLVSHLCNTWITPHQLTIAWITLAFITTALFATGYLISGIVLAFIIGILDGLDGKQARLKVETSSSGTLEHRFDSLFEVGWPSALAYHFYSSGQLAKAFVYLVILVGAQALDGIAKGGIYLAFAKMKTPPNLLDRVVRLFGGRRNVYIWILLFAVILGAPAQALVVMAWWQAATAIIDLPHAGWLLYRASGGEGSLQVSERR